MSDVLGNELDPSKLPVLSGTVLAKAFDKLQSDQNARQLQAAGRVRGAQSDLSEAEFTLSGAEEELAEQASATRDLFPARKLHHLRGSLDDIEAPSPTHDGSLLVPSSWEAFRESVEISSRRVVALGGKLITWDHEWGAVAKTVRDQFEGAKELLRTQREAVEDARSRFEHEVASSALLEVTFDKERAELLMSMATWLQNVDQEYREFGWEAPEWNSWEPAQSIPNVVRVGEYVVGRGVKDPKLRGIGVPALVEFPGSKSLVINAGACRGEAESLMSSVLLRLIAYSQPGAYTMTFVDPVGLGGSFAPFLHFNEFDETVLTGRAVSQANDINAVLDELLVHIETVTQQYLRSSYASLAEYNEAAGTIAERFRYLVVADYPAAFDSRASEKLRSIMQRGPRCGVYTMVTGGEGASSSTHFTDVIPLSRLDPEATSIYAGSKSIAPQSARDAILDPANIAALRTELKEHDAPAAPLEGEPWLDLEVPIRVTGADIWLNSPLVDVGGQAEIDDPVLLICDFAIEDPDALRPALTAAQDACTMLVVVSHQIKERHFDYLLGSSENPGFSFAAIAPPRKNLNTGEFLADMAVLTGGSVLKTEAQLRGATLADCGSADRIMLTDRTTLIEGADGQLEDLKARRNEIRAAFDDASSPNQSEVIRMRWNKEFGGRPASENPLVGPKPDALESIVNALRSSTKPVSEQASINGVDTGIAQLALDTPPELVLREEGEQGLFGRILIGAAVAGKKSVSKTVTQEQSFRLMAQSRAWREQTGTDEDLKIAATGDVETWWQTSSLKNVVTPIGRAGARDACCVAFDSDMLTSAIVIGTTGAGKSSLLHAFILGSCIQYSPEELELYLLDSKQGVEFKVYENLPHARAVAIRNEREFGLSVLEGLRAEIDVRAAKIKGNTGGAEVGLPGYRKATGERMPRVILVADEFHELFETSDTLGRRAAELLDDLIRQGRSYGIHVVLGSQTLDGAEALPRHSIGLIQTRIAFACREQDADFVMTEENREVKTLSKAGDGVFNPSRGNPDKNVRFQGAFVPTDERVEIVKALRAHAVGRFDRVPIVFDGDAAAPLDEITPERFPVEPSAPGALTLRIGEPCAITGSVVADLPRRPGANIAAVLDDEAALSLIHAAFGTVAWGETRCEAALIDFSGSDDAVLDAFKQHESIEVVRRRQAGEVLARFNELVQERVELEEYKAPARILIVTGLKGLRNVTEDIADGESFESMLTRIATDGPEVGVHVILIGDTLKTVERRVDRGTLGEFAIRIASRMGEDDSRNWIESDAAMSLRPQQGLIWDDATGEVVRFKRYEKASENWVSALQDIQPAGVTSDE